MTLQLRPSKWAPMLRIHPSKYPILWDYSWLEEHLYSSVVYRRIKFITENGGVQADDDYAVHGKIKKLNEDDRKHTTL